MALEKATIKHVIPAGDSIDVLFNPTEYRLSKSNQFVEVSVPGLAAPPLQFGRGNAETLSMQLYFDTYEQGSDVRAFTSKVTDLLKIDSDLHAPPVCVFSWGQLNFVGVLDRAEQQFLLFFSDGTPARATVDVTFKEFFQGDAQLGALQSANFAKQYMVRRGDTLSSIANREYGDSTLWRPIAEENNIDNPLALHPGQVLSIPAIE